MSHNGVDIVKDAIPPTLAGTGLGMTLTPVFVIQVIGCIVGIAGIILGIMRLKVANVQAKESIRSNDLRDKEIRLKYESANSKETEAKQAKQSNDCKEGY